jgi:UPF0716 protein FxsA
MMLLIKLGEVMGFWPTLGLVVGTGIVGAWLAQLEGLRVWVRIQRDLQQGHVPADAGINGLVIFLGGVVLLTPGLLTDIFGLLCLIPWTRHAMICWLGRKFQRMTQTGRTDMKYIVIK